MDHQDILDLIEAGELEEAQALIDKRNEQRGISGHDLQTIEAALAAAKPKRGRKAE